MTKTALENMLSDFASDYTKEQLYTKTLMLEKQIEQLEAERDRLNAILENCFSIASTCPELNMSNYDEDEVSELNDAMIEIYKLLPIFE